LFVARSAGKTARFIQSSTRGGPWKIEQGLSGEEKEVADWANDRFLSIARSAGKAVRFIQSGTMRSPSKTEHELSREKKEEKPEQPSGARETKESGPADETTEGSGSSPPGVKPEGEAD
jgi:Sec-independent protein translocase protein TatA